MISPVRSTKLKIFNINLRAGITKAGLISNYFKLEIAFYSPFITKTPDLI